MPTTLDGKTSESCRYVQDFYYNKLHWCGCGMPEEVMALMRRVLEAMDAKWTAWRAESGWTDKCEERYRAFQSRLRELGLADPAVEYTYLYILDAAGLTEHGGGVGGCWLTPEGETLLSHLKAVAEIEWDDYEL